MMNQIIIKVAGMSCQHCVKAVEEALKALPGVETARVDLAAGQVSVHYDSTKTDPLKMQEAIENQGYDVIA